MEKKFQFQIYSDYRTGPQIISCDPDTTEYNPDGDSEQDCFFEITFELPEKGNRIYLVNEFPSYDTKPMWMLDLGNSSGQKVYEKMFSQIYDTMPFQVTDYTSSYKEIGEYPEISKEIAEMEDIARDITNHIKDDIEGVYFLCVISKEGKLLFEWILSPII